MSYEVIFSDSNKYSSRLVIDDGNVDSGQLSISFIGKNASNYAEALSTNFLHLLENFANSEPPNNPTEGQLWFDTSDATNKKLRVNDGSSLAAPLWKPINGIYQQDIAPNAASKGDVWVDTAKAQLFLTLDGTNWTLVGPSYSSTLKTGSYPESITDIFGNVRNIIKQYVDDEVVEIISPDSFTPQLKISGFTTIKAGLNLTSVNGAILSATAFAAQNIYVTSPTTGFISGNNFVRNDISNSINGTLNIKNGSLTIGIDPRFKLTREGNYTNSFINSTPDGGIFSFQILDPSTESYNKILTIDGLTEGSFTKKYVGINNESPQHDLHVVGNTYIDGSTTVTNNLTIAGSAVFSKSITANTATFNSTATLVKGLVVGSSADSALLTPITLIGAALDTKYNIGTPARQFANVYSREFTGNLIGSAAVASSLTSISSWAIVGDMASEGNLLYKGQAGDYTFTTTIQPAIISSKPIVTNVQLTDEILVSVSTATFNGIPVAGGLGSGASFNIIRGPSSYESVTIASSGTDYVNGDILIVNGTYLGGTTANNITITLGPTGTSGGILGSQYTYLGSPVAGLARATKNALIGNVLDRLVPPGAVMPYAGILPPSGWLLCDGSVVDKTDYPDLYVAIGYLYGSTTLDNKFKLPDMRGRMVVGYDDMTNDYETARVNADRVSGANTPNLLPQPEDGAAAAVAGGNDRLTQVSTVTNFGGTITGVTTNIMNPFLALNYIIKV